jgi:hypothetical protein
MVMLSLGLKFRNRDGWARRLENQMVGRGTRPLSELRMNRFNEHMAGVLNILDISAADDFITPTHVH